MIDQGNVFKNPSLDLTSFKQQEFSADEEEEEDAHILVVGLISAGDFRACVQTNRQSLSETHSYHQHSSSEA